MFTAAASAAATTSGSGSQDFVEDGFSLLLVGVLGQGQLTNQNLPSLRQHALLARGQPTLLVPTPQIADDLRHLVHVTGSQLLQVRLVPTRPVGRLLGMRGGAEHLEDLVQAFLADDVANADVLGVVSRNSNGEIALRHLEDEIFSLLALDGSAFDRSINAAP